MFKTKSIQAEHKDLIHDVAYDYHGRRMATCSSDQYVKVRVFKHKSRSLALSTVSVTLMS